MGQEDHPTIIQLLESMRVVANADSQREKQIPVSGHAFGRHDKKFNRMFLFCVSWYVDGGQLVILSPFQQNFSHIRTLGE